MEAPGARFEVIGVERVRPHVAIPADDVERMAVEHQLLESVARTDRERVLAALIERLELVRCVEVAL